MRFIFHTRDGLKEAFRIESNGNEVLYWKTTPESSLDDKPETIYPSGEQWNRFWTFMQECNGWADQYEEPGQKKMTTWFVDVENATLRILSSGSNDYPENFEGFLKEVKLLIGGREFG